MTPPPPHGSRERSQGMAQGMVMHWLVGGAEAAPLPAPEPGGWWRRLSWLPGTALRRRLAAAERHLAQAQAEVIGAARGKADFMSTAGHDLRHPVQAALLFHDLLSRRLRGTANEELIANLGQSLETMKVMLEALLEVSRLESSGVQPRLAEIPVRTVLVWLAAEFAPLAQAVGLTLRVADSGAVIRSDPELLLRLLGKLVANAIKFTEQGGVLVGCRRRGADLHIQVWDTGLGIPDDAIAGLCTEFRRLHTGRDKSGSGFGLGLSVVERLALILGHPVGVRSVLGRGSMFQVVVPLAGGGAGDAAASRSGPGRQA